MFPHEDFSINVIQLCFREHFENLMVHAPNFYSNFIDFLHSTIESDVAKFKNFT